MTKGMDLVFKYGQMVQNMRAIGRATKLMVEESFTILMEISMMENGSKIKHMALASIFKLMDLNIVVSG